MKQSFKGILQKTVCMARKLIYGSTKKQQLLTLLFDKSLNIGDKHKPRFISNFAKSRHLETHTVDAIFALRMYKY